MKPDLAFGVFLLLASCGSQPVISPVGAGGQPEPASASTTPVGPSTSTAVGSPVAMVGLPVEVTGRHIGDKIVDTGTTPVLGDISKRPEWLAVGKDGVVMGYQHFDMNVVMQPIQPDNPEAKLAALNEMSLTIYDEDGRPIGKFENGFPVIDKASGG